MKLNKYILYITFISLMGCIVLSANTSPPVLNDPYTGLYYVHGSKIVTFYKCPFIGLCGPDDGPFHDTTRIASVVVVKFMQDKADTLHFFGLPGADEGEIKFYHGNTHKSDRVGGITLYNDIEDVKVYGIQSGNLFEIQFNEVGFFYEATGNITQGIFNLQAKFTTRTTTVNYDLTGEKFSISK